MEVDFVTVAHPNFTHILIEINKQHSKKLGAH
jgi:hypothetical protein